MQPETQLIIAVAGIVISVVGSAVMSARWLDGKIEDLDTKLSKEIKSLDTKQDANIQRVEDNLSKEIKSLDTKQDANIQRVEDNLSGDIKEVRQASADAHKEILAQLCEIRVEQGKHSERFKSIEQRLDMTREDDV